MTVNITLGTSPANGGPLVSTGTLFIAAATAPGVGPQTAPAEIHSIADFEAAVAPRTTSSVTTLWDYVDTFFRSGGSTAYVITYGTVGQYAPALALMPPSLGPGQLVVVNETASQALYVALASAAAAANRVALLDVKSTDTTAALMEATGAYLGTLGANLSSNATYVGLFGSWLNVPAPAGVIGAVARQVPASAVVAALCNLVDVGGNPNQPAGGTLYPVSYATSPVYLPTDAERSALLAAGVNCWNQKFGVLTMYDFLTPLGQQSATPYGQLNAGRTRMSLISQAQPIGENYRLQDIDGEGLLAGQLGKDLAAVCKGLYKAGALYGDTEDDAYSVNVSASINTEANAALGILSAEVDVKLSQAAETVNINLVTVPITGLVP